MAGRKTGSQGLTQLELRILQVLWKLGPSSVQVVQEALGSELAYTTVQTMLNVLHRKGHVKRTLSGRAYAYRASASQEKTLRHTLGDMIDRLFGGSPEEMVMSLVQTRHLDAEKLAELSRRVSNAKKNQGGEGA